MRDDLEALARAEWLSLEDYCNKKLEEAAQDPELMDHLSMQVGNELRVEAILWKPGERGWRPTIGWNT